MKGIINLAIVVGPSILAALLGIYFCRVIRMREYGWKIGVVLASVSLAASFAFFNWPPKLGIDLSGGVILIYEVDEEKTSQSAQAAPEDGDDPGGGGDQVDITALVQALQRRINPSGVEDVVIRKYGSNQVEIIIPKVTESEIERIKRTITKSGYLKFQILANEQVDRDIIELAELARNSPIPSVRAATQIKKGDEVVAEWVRIAPEDNVPEGAPPQFKVEVDGRVRRDLTPGEPEALMMVETDSRLRVDGGHLRSVSAGFDNTMQPCVRFRMSSRGASIFGFLTSNNLPDKQSGLYRRLGIVMDDELISAPRIMSTITSEGEITGRFSQEEVDFLVNVLRAGRLPAVLHDNPISENSISPLLGLDTIRKGSYAITVSLMAVLVFMLVYYRFSGVIACLALATNLLLILAMMILISAAFSLAGLAGLVLTVGMSVDANVLIFERIREELNRGAALRMAIRNGFSRATTTIVDANLTTLITALVLYAIGTDQIRGFAVTLILGIVVSMYTAIFCSRITFDIAERKRWISRLNMMHILGVTTIDFIGKRKLAGTLSVCLIVVGLVAVVARGKQIFDIDFLGGTSVQAVLKTPLQIQQVRELSAGLADDVSVTEVIAEGRARGTIYKIDTSLERVETLEEKISEIFRDSAGDTLLVMHEMTFSAPVRVAPDASLPGSTPDDTTGQSGGSEKAAANSHGTGDVARATNGAHAPVLLAMADGLAQPAGSGQDQQSSGSATTGTADDADGANAKAPADTLELRSQTEVKFREEISAAALRDQFTNAAESLELSVPQLDFFHPEAKGQQEAAFKDWVVTFGSDRSETEAILQRVQAEIQGKPYLLSSSTIGGAVAGKTQNMAIAALLTSLIGIVAYIWIRFQHLEFGLAAVVALLHDVAVTIGAVALSLWLSKVFGFLLIDEFKISLPVVAALLTIIGYSLNDTIVVFDRIREVKGKSPELTSDMVNVSINQTLSRTLLTSTTTLLVVVILYAFGGQGIHGFAFALLVGVMVGTYSSIFIASPALLWMTRRSGKSTPTKAPVTA